MFTSHMYAYVCVVLFIDVFKESLILSLKKPLTFTFHAQPFPGISK